MLRYLFISDDLGCLGCRRSLVLSVFVLLLLSCLPRDIAHRRRILSAREPHENRNDSQKLYETSANLSHGNGPPASVEGATECFCDNDKFGPGEAEVTLVQDFQAGESWPEASVNQASRNLSRYFASGSRQVSLRPK